MTIIRINGETVSVDMESSVHISKKAVYVNGSKVSPTATLLEVSIEGDIKKLTIDCGDVTMKGNVENLQINCGNANIEGAVKGNVSAHCGNINIMK